MSARQTGCVYVYLHSEKPQGHGFWGCARGIAGFGEPFSGFEDRHSVCFSELRGVGECK